MTMIVWKCLNCSTPQAAKDGDKPGKCMCCRIGGGWLRMVGKI